MKINPYQSVQQNIYRNKVNTPKKTAADRMGSDKLEISSAALHMQKGTRIEKEREEKTVALKKQIEAGEYEVNAQKVAQKFYEFWNE